MDLLLWIKTILKMSRKEIDRVDLLTSAYEFAAMIELTFPIIGWFDLIAST